MYTSYGDLKPYAASEALLLLNESRGGAYFVPEGYEPILIRQEELTAEVRTEIRRGNAHLRIPRALHECRLPSYIVTSRKTTSRVTNDISSPASQKRNPPRPPNAFILYRKAKQVEVNSRNVGISNNDVSRIIGNMWKHEIESVKEHYQQAAEVIKCQHRSMYPDYRYRPRKTEPNRATSPKTSSTSRKGLSSIKATQFSAPGCEPSFSIDPGNCFAANMYSPDALVENLTNFEGPAFTYSCS